MAVDDILKKIMADAEERARSILSEGQESADVVLEEARDKVDAQKGELDNRARQHAEEERNRIVTLARLSARRELLNEKQGLIAGVFDEAAKRIAELGRGEYREFVKRLLMETVETGNEEVLVGEGDDRIDQAFLEDLSKELGRGKGLKLSEERLSTRAGFVLREGRIETNCALETIMRDARERLETEVAGILFTDDSGKG